MFELLLLLAAGIAIGGVLIALDGGRDIFHPLVFIAPMLFFLYTWMPWKLYSSGGLFRYFSPDQILFVQRLNVLGILAFVGAALSVGFVGRATRRQEELDSPLELTSQALSRLLIGSAIAGSIGLGCWLITIINVGGIVNAFSTSYSGGWDDSGYVRDGSLLLLVGVLLAISALALGARKAPGLALIAVFGTPWVTQALLTARRGPTFAFVVVTLMGWYLNRRKRPPVVAAGVAAFCLGWLVLFLVTNRGSIYLGSDFDVSTDVSSVVDKPDTGNEYIYGTGSIIGAERANHYFWMRRYLAQILVRPIPSAIWPTKYEDFGVPELLHNAGTGEGITAALGWVGAPGSAPGIVADLFVELWWLCIGAMACLGWGYAYIWKRAVRDGGAWSSQYVVLSALSIYLVMQTMEAVIFRTLLLSIPCWLTWRWALHAPRSQAMLQFHGQELERA